MAEVTITDATLWRPHSTAPLVLALADSAGRRGYGQAAPLVGRSRTTLEGCRQALLGLIEQLPTWAEPSLTTGTAMPPEASMAWETATADLLAQAEHRSLARHLDASAREEIEVNGLVDAANDPLDVVAEGYRCIKVKVGRRPALELEQIADLRAALGPDGSIRLDANQGFDARSAETFMRQAAQFDISYIEEPTADPTEWPALAEATGIRVAADESISSRSEAERFFDHRWAAVTVLKPALWSSPASIIQTIRRAQAEGFGVTITSSRDGVLGSLLAGHIAAVAGSSPAGLGWADVRPAELDWTDVEPGPKLVLPVGLGVSVDLLTR